MSHEVAVSRTIAAAPDDVWAVLTDVARWSSLLRQVVSVQVLTPGEYAVGTRWRETRSMFGRDATQELWVTEVEAPRRTVLGSEFGGMTYRMEHLLEPSGDHTDSRPRTRVTVRLQSDESEDETLWLWRVLGALGSRATQESIAQDLADLAGAVERPETRDMLVIHRLFTRELAAGPDLVRGVPAGDLHRAGVVADHLAVVLNTLVDHHHGEDVLIWPLLAERTTIAPDLSARLDEQHEQIHADIIEARILMTRWLEAADGGVRDQLAELVTSLGAEIRDHLETEENEILPLIEQHLTRVEYERLVAHGRESLPRDKAAMIVQLFLEGANRSERTLLLNDYPPAMQLFIRTVGARQYRRYVRRLRARGQ
ncbi:SRPBCC family protein [Granulicoccus sp. GXG6511]|uniref:SRPBCC family protein n=1 Tax=Granulicoccus sp. GXG6511 TaxID=3381351 RepID=UPI003D7E1737